MDRRKSDPLSTIRADMRFVGQRPAAVPAVRNRSFIAGLDAGSNVLQLGTLGVASFETGEGLADLRGTLEAVLDPGGEAFHDDGVNVPGNPVVFHTRRREFAQLGFFENFKWVGIKNGRPSDQHLIEDTADRIDIRLKRRFPQELLGRHIRR